MSAPRFHDAYIDAAGETVLLIDYVDDAQLLPFADKSNLIAAARWIGRFHLVNEPRVAALPQSIKRYSVSYYLGWMERTVKMWGGADFPWLQTFRRCWEDLAGELLAPPETIIHGEYYPLNILVHSSGIIPVDWETAAIAAGEIDLATLIEGWSPAEKRICEIEYAENDGPEAPQPSLHAGLSLVRSTCSFVGSDEIL